MHADDRLRSKQAQLAAVNRLISLSSSAKSKSIAEIYIYRL